jgi:hypothetical protein
MMSQYLWVSSSTPPLSPPSAGFSYKLPYGVQCATYEGSASLGKPRPSALTRRRGAGVGVGAPSGAAGDGDGRGGRHQPDVEQAGDHGLRALHCAARGGHATVVSFLEEHEATAAEAIAAALIAEEEAAARRQASGTVRASLARERAVGITTTT